MDAIQKIRRDSRHDDPDTDWAVEGLQYTFPHDPSRLFGTALAADAGADPAAGAYRYFLQDAYGSTRQLRLQDKSLAGAWEYSPYGTLYHGGGTESVFAYTGQIHDANAGLHYFPFRYYNPALARWLTPEPTGADGPNLYWYGNANPTSGVDLLGRDSWKIWSWIKHIFGLEPDEAVDNAVDKAASAAEAAAKDGLLGGRRVLPPGASELMSAAEAAPQVAGAAIAGFNHSMSVFDLTDGNPNAPIPDRLGGRGCEE